MKTPGHTPGNTLLSVSNEVSDLWLLVHLGHRHTFHEHTTCCFHKTSSQMLSVPPLWYTPQSPDPNSASDGRSWRHVTRPTANQQPGKGKGQGQTLDIAPFPWNTTSEALRYGTCSQGISVLPAYPQSSFAIGMRHICLCLPSYSWYSFTDPGDGRLSWHQTRLLVSWNTLRNTIWCARQKQSEQCRILILICIILSYYLHQSSLQCATEIINLIDWLIKEVIFSSALVN